MPILRFKSDQQYGFPFEHTRVNLEVAVGSKSLHRGASQNRSGQPCECVFQSLFSAKENRVFV